MGRTFDTIDIIFIVLISIYLITLFAIILVLVYGKKEKTYLVVDNKIRVKNIDVAINGHEASFELHSTFFGDCVNRIDISSYVKSGKNIISLSLNEKRKELKAYIEIGREDDR